MLSIVCVADSLFKLKFPLTSSFSSGIDVPIPTLPLTPLVRSVFTMLQSPSFAVFNVVGSIQLALPKLSDCSMYPSFEFSVNWKCFVFKESKTSALPPKVKKG